MAVLVLVGIQQFYDAVGWDQIVHVYPLKPQQWERHYPTDWIVNFSSGPQTAQRRTPQDADFIPV